jgi:hypothetical protein
MISPKAIKPLRLLIIGAAAASVAACGGMFGDRSSSSSGTQSRSPQQVSASSNAVSPDLVRSVQEQLRARGVNAGPVDGIWGPGTYQGLQKFQSSQGLPATGQLDAPTLQALGITGQGSTAARTSQSSAAQGASAAGAGSRVSTSDAPNFRTLDTNNDGEISRAEAAADAGLFRGFDRADRDRSGGLSIEEFNGALDLTTQPGPGSSGTGR